MVELIEILIQVVIALILTPILMRSAPSWSRVTTAAVAALATPLAGVYFAVIGFETRYDFNRCTIDFCGKIALKLGGLSVGISIIGFVVAILVSRFLSQRRRVAVARAFE